ncbi:MAG: S41 family peptidase [Acidobacteria bacterium]|nr:S41 family peptidase [Acidobacteriota bacterium]
MKSRGRLFVLAVSIPIIAFAVIGGFMGNAMAAKQDSYQYLRIFEDVVTRILNDYVEEPKIDDVMAGAMHGLADGLDPDSAYLTAQQTKSHEQNESAGGGQTGIELTRQYYLRVIAARDGSPAAKAGLQPGDYIRAIDGQSTRDTTVFQGMRLLRGKPGTTVRLTVLRGNAVEPHDVQIVREALSAAPVRGRMVATDTGYLRIAEFSKTTSDELRSEAAALRKSGATRFIVDLRGTAFGDIDAGLGAARLFVPSGTLAFRQERGKEREPVAAASGDGALNMPVAVLTDLGTSGAAEIFAAALKDNKRGSLIGERTLGRAGQQKLVRLPDGSSLLLTHLTYLTPGGAPIHEKGVTPDVAVEQPDVEFGDALPTPDKTLEKALEHLTSLAKAA